MNKYNIIIPAAGSARRLRPLTDSIPKSLLRINNKPIIEHQLYNLPEEYVKKAIVILGYMGEKIKNHIESLDLKYPVKYYYNENYKNTNCAYSLIKAKQEMSEGSILINCDLLFKKKNIERLFISDYPNAVTVRKNDYHKTDLQDILIYNNKIHKWSIKLIDANAEVMGPLKISKTDSHKVIEYFKSLTVEEQFKMHCFGLFSNCINIIDFHPVFINDGAWVEIDTKNDLEKAEIMWKTTNDN